MINFELTSYYVRFVSRFFYAYECLIVPASFVKRMTLSPLNCHCTFVKNQLTIIIWIISGLLHRLTCLSFCQTTLLWSLYFIVSLKIRQLQDLSPGSVESSDFVLLLKIILTISVLLRCHICFRIDLLLSSRKLAGIFISIDWIYRLNQGELPSYQYWLSSWTWYISPFVYIFDFLHWCSVVFSI